MSDAPSQPSSTQPLPPPHERNGCMTAVMLAIGLLLLLPGICAIIIASFDPKEAFGDVTTLIWFLTLLAIAAGGIALIRHALKRQR